MMRNEQGQVDFALLTLLVLAAILVFVILIYVQIT